MFLKTYGDEEVLFEEGSVGKHMYGIVSGSVRIVKKAGGGEAVVATLGTLFSALDSRAEFGYIMKSIAAYSRRV